MAHGELFQSFDSFLGGEQIFPSAMNVQELIKNRMEEILMLTEALKESPFRGQVFQRLPKHMRRRQMSHYIKRLPRRLRHSYVSSHQDEIPSPRKCPNRKYRRRPKNLLLEYNRRQKENIWLETHIWHAKRFHMATKWGYRLPEQPSNKSVRACYRAAAYHCFLSDISFYNCIELRGLEDKILEGLQQCVSPSCGLTFTSKMCKNGLHEGSVMLYHPCSFPYAAIGHVSFLWKPIEEGDGDRILWIFTHPLFHNEVVVMLKKLFDMSEHQTPEKKKKLFSENEPKINKPEDKKPQKTKKGKLQLRICKQNNENLKLDMKNVPNDRTPKFINQNGSIQMTLLKDTINRFRLIGPLSLAIISAAFDVKMPLAPSQSALPSNCFASITAPQKLSLKRNCSEAFDCTSTNVPKKIKMDESTTVNNDKFFWWRSYYENEFHRNCLGIQENFYEGLITHSCPEGLPPGMVFSLVIKDPRLTIPSKRIKVPTTALDVGMITMSDTKSELCQSPLWKSEIRDEVSRIKVPTSDINKARSKLIVPGSDVGSVLAEDKQARVPLIVIQRPGARNVGVHTGSNGFGSGFDILVPAGWAMPVWLSLIYRGARTGGLQENVLLTLESKSLNEYFQPDSFSGELENMDRYKKLKTSYFRRPPSRRQNFQKMGVSTPFHYPWKCLIRDWNSYSKHIPNGGNSEMKFYVLRDRKKLSELQDALHNLKKQVKCNEKSEFTHSFKEEEMDCLVQVSIESFGKGTPKDYAMVCLPDEFDMDRFKTKDCPLEKSHIDTNEGTRKLLRKEHLNLLKSLRRKRKNDKIKMKELQRDNLLEKSIEKGDFVKRQSSPSKTSLKDYNKKIESLWLQEPESIESVINSSSRTIIGYIVLGGYSFTLAQGLGLGYIALRGLLHMFSRCHKRNIYPFVLFRNSSSYNYGFGKITICSS